ncbi:hypothetical protein [Prosthecomicrobium pneumaticum]|uniref:Glycosyltransferase RgtA/B/C/D-like domain-containing protein n=1 Tax=Prosthecomicrobium pneumaticum TaxID=81895 RepID=A0A7W9L3U5_9HYPH|nr:hypothetical protein [Prosthecomicrobium pneumaticum]MBB5754895.1 hypothetical protein [Prosthecomicrobium pneumaticum]
MAKLKIMFRNQRLLYNSVTFLFLISCLAFRIRSGMNITPDSLSYLYAARGAFTPEGMLDVDGPPGMRLTLFPPLYPLMIAIVGLVAPSLEAAAALVNLAAFAGCVVLFALAAGRAGLSPRATALVTALIFVNPFVQMLFTYVWSEGLYLFLLLSLVYVFFRLPEIRPDWAGIVTGLLVGAAFLTRYHGLSLVPPTFLALASRPGLSLRAGIRSLVWFGLIATSIVVIVVFTNLRIDGTTFGERPPSDDTLAFALRQTAMAFGSLILPVSRLTLAWSAVGVIGLILVTAIILRGLLRRYREPFFVGTAAIVFFHTLLLIYSQISTAIDPISFRLLGPAFPLVVLLCAREMSGRTRSGGAARGRRMVAAGAAAIYLALLTGVALSGAERGPAGFKLALANPPEIPELCKSGTWPIFSNRPGYLRFLGLADNAKPTPRQEEYRRTEREDDWDEFKDSLKAGGGCIVWVEAAPGPLPPPEVILGGAPEGITIYLLSANEGLSVAMIEPP